MRIESVRSGDLLPSFERNVPLVVVLIVGLLRNRIPFLEL